MESPDLSAGATPVDVTSEAVPVPVAPQSTLEDTLAGKVTAAPVQPITLMNLTYLDMSEVLAEETFNCRGYIAPVDVAQLAEDIDSRAKEHPGTSGLIQPVVAMPLAEFLQRINPGKKWRLVAGYRRFLAHRMLKRTKIEAIINNQLDETSARFLNLSENIQRENLNIMQEANALKKFFDDGMTEEEVMKRLNLSRGWVQVRHLLLKLPLDVQQEAALGTIGQVNIRNLYTKLKKNGEEAMYDLLKFIKTAKGKGDEAMKKYEVLAKESNPNAKKMRTKLEIVAMIETIMESEIRACFGTRCLAWVAGEISTNELYLDIDIVHAKQGFAPFVRPVQRFKDEGVDPLDASAAEALNS